MIPRIALGLQSHTVPQFSSSRLEDSDCDLALRTVLVDRVNLARLIIFACSVNHYRHHLGKAGRMMRVFHGSYNHGRSRRFDLVQLVDELIYFLERELFKRHMSFAFDPRLSCPCRSAHPEAHYTFPGPSTIVLKR